MRRGQGSGRPFGRRHIEQTVAGAETDPRRSDEPTNDTRETHHEMSQRTGDLDARQSRAAQDPVSGLYEPSHEDRRLAGVGTGNRGPINRDRANVEQSVPMPTSDGPQGVADPDGV